ncbi:hypothetical protein ACF0H5_011664 [Mactra antiquata]
MAVDIDAADIAAIVLGAVLLMVVIATIIICILLKKGYIGEPDQTKIMPTMPEIHTTPESLREFSSAAIDKAKRNKGTHDSSSTDPIIYMLDDVYHPPNSRPTAENLADLKHNGTLANRTPKIHYTKGKSSKRKRKSSKHSRTLPDFRNRNESPGGTEPYPDNSVFISEKGGMKFTMYYESQSPYIDRQRMANTF